MKNEEQERIIIPDESGEEHLFDVLFTFDIDKTGYSYIALTPVEQQVEEEVEVYAFRFEDDGEDENDLKLFPIESEEEWDIVEEMLNTLSDQNS